VTPAERAAANTREKKIIAWTLEGKAAGDLVEHDQNGVVWWAVFTWTGSDTYHPPVALFDDEETAQAFAKFKEHEDCVVAPVIFIGGGAAPFEPATLVGRDNFEVPK
jgi:hypothetical protein